MLIGIAIYVALFRARWRFSTAEEIINSVGQISYVDLIVRVSIHVPAPSIAIAAAKAKGATTVGFSGSGGDLIQMVDIPISVASTFIPVIEEAHLILIHIICGEVEERLFSDSGVRIRTPDY